MPNGRVEYDSNERKDGCLNVNKYSLMLMRESEETLNPLSLSHSLLSFALVHNR